MWDGGLRLFKTGQTPSPPVKTVQIISVSEESSDDKSTCHDGLDKVLGLGDRSNARETCQDKLGKGADLPRRSGCLVDPSRRVG